MLGVRRSETATLNTALEACHAALKEFTRDRLPLDWAQAQDNLGNALEKLGERESGTARLDEAVVAYHAALEERTRDRLPLQWAMTQSNLGDSLLAVGEREQGTGDLEASVAAYDAALPEFGFAPHYAQKCKAGRDRAIVLLKERQGLSR